MHNILLIGNPNVGKSTLFNSLTKSCEHTGNFHGVTVDAKSKNIKLEKEEYQVVDLPGMYSMLSFSYEEEVAKKELLKGNSTVLMLVDANSLNRNLYLALQLKELGISFKILINNYTYFRQHKNQIDVQKLSNCLGVDVEIVNAKKVKADKKLFKINKNNKNLPYFFEIIKQIKQKTGLDEAVIIKSLNGISLEITAEQNKIIKEFLPEIIKARYSYIKDVLNNCVTQQENFVYGVSRADKILLNLFVMSVGFIVTFLFTLYAVFFLIGPLLSNVLSHFFELCVVNPVMNFLYLATDNVWLLEFFKSGVFSSFLTIISFLPQVCLLFVFLTVLEDSGLISRMAYVFDDFLSPLGLNGKAIYTMLLGLGCNSMSTLATRNMNGKNLKIKTAIINPYISCMARLPVFVLIASAFFGLNAYLVVAGLYLLGFVVLLVMAVVLNKTILPTKNSELLLEFPPLRSIDIKHIFQTVKINAIDFTKRVFTVVLCVGIIVWILSHTRYNLQYTQTMTDSILFWIADKFTLVFAPIGLNKAGVVCALMVGVLAKELIVSTISICNNVISSKALALSIVSTTSVVNFNMASAVSFLIFSLLYCPCASNLAIIKKETDKFYMWFSIISQFTVAYLISFIVYQTLNKGFGFALTTMAVIVLIVVSLFFVIKKVKQRKCLTCGKCK